MSFFSFLSFFLKKKKKKLFKLIEKNMLVGRVQCCNLMDCPLCKLASRPGCLAEDSTRPSITPRLAASRHEEKNWRRNSRAAHQPRCASAAMKKNTPNQQKPSQTVWKNTSLFVFPPLVPSLSGHAPFVNGAVVSC